MRMLRWRRRVPGDHVPHIIDNGPQFSETEKRLNELTDKIAALKQTVDNPLVEAGGRITKEVLEDTGAAKLIEERFGILIGGIDSLMSGLDEIAKIHPFIAVAVIAFKAAYKLQMMRRENDKRIQALYVEMKEMIEVLLQLQDVTGDSGKNTISTMLKAHVDKAAYDIKLCANACDTYSKTRLLVKVLLGSSWETKFIAFATEFAENKKNFLLTLAIHASKTASWIRRDVANIEKIVQNTNDRLEIIFAAYVPDDIISLKRDAEAQGALDSLRDPKDLQALNKKEDIMSCGSTEARVHINLNPFTEHDVAEELKRNIDQMLEDNLGTFERSFDMYLGQQSEQLSHWINEATNQLKQIHDEGPHDKILDPELKTIWKEMGWKRNVKSRIFVMTLQDHFREKVQGRSDLDSSPRADNWAIQFVSLAHVQPITEALSDNGSGYITVTDLNQFTDSIPKGWSLQHWLAYWAVGWQYSATLYMEKIRKTINAQATICPRVLPENRSRVETYLKNVTLNIVKLSAGLEPSHLPEGFHRGFQEFIDQELDCIRKNLASIEYNLDTRPFVYIVAGPGKRRIEHYAMPLIHLLLERDLKIFQIAQHRILDYRELTDCAVTIHWVFSALTRRANELQNVFFAQGEINRDIKARFRSVACGLFKYCREGDDLELWSSHTLLEKHSPRGVSEKELAQIDSPISELTKVLRYESIDPKTLASLHIFDISLSLAASICPDEPTHFRVFCDGCKNFIRTSGMRVTCMDCIMHSIWDTVDFCADRECYSKFIDRGRPYKPHLATHRVLKLRTELQWYQIKLTEGGRLRCPSLDAADSCNGKTGGGTIIGSKLSVGSQSYCKICQVEMGPPFWCCTICVDYMICDRCEARSLLLCTSCGKKYRQPSWYYGSRPDDDFRCQACSCDGAVPSEGSGRGVRHTYIHPLVRYQGNVSEDEDEPPLDEDIAESTLVSLMKGLPPLVKDCTPEQLAFVRRAFTDLDRVMTELKSKDDR